MTRAVILTLALLGAEARAEDGGVPEGVVLEVVSGVVTVRGGAIHSVDAGIYLDEDAAVRVGQELASARAELAEYRKAPVPTPAHPVAVTVAAVLGVAVGLVTGVLLVRGL